MPRFVILEHDYPQCHWDFMLEAGSVLRTWRLAEPPRTGSAIAATATFDHRPLYLDYEGPVSGGRGQVIRWDAGAFRWEEQASDRVVVSLQGEQVQGRVTLCRISSSERWSFSLDTAKEDSCR